MDALSLDEELADFISQGALIRLASATATGVPDLCFGLACFVDPARQRQAMLVDVDCDDGIAAGDFCRHQARQSDRAYPEHRKSIARPGLHRVEHGAGAGLAAAGKGS